MGAIVNHLFTDLRVQDQTPLEVLEGDIASLEVKAFFLRTLEKTCWIALVVLAAAVFAISYNFVVLTGVMPLAMTGFILASPALVIALIYLAPLANQYALLASHEEKVKEKLRTIQHWGQNEVQQFFQNHQLELHRALPTLTQIDPNNPYSLLPPLIARYQFLSEEMTALRKDHEEAPAKLEQRFRQREEREGKPMESADKQLFRFTEECGKWKKIENIALPDALNAATLLQIIENPTTTDMDVIPLSLEIPGVGHSEPRTYPERMFGKLRGNDDYFIFHPGLDRPALSHEAIEAVQMNPDKLKLILYPRA